MNTKTITLKTLALVILLAGLLAVAGAQTVVQSHPQARLMARRAAITDAQRNLAETIYGVRIDSQTTVRNFVTENDEIRSRIDAIIQGASVVDTRYNPDGTCTVRMEVPVALLQNVLQRRFGYYSDVVSAEGNGAPNPVAQPSPITQTPAFEETWYNLVIRATGTGVPPADLVDTPQGRLMAERAAHADAIRQLGENIKGVRVTANTTVRNFVTENDSIRTRFQGFLQGARRVQTRHLEDGVCEVDVEISLDGMRNFVRSGQPPVVPNISGQRPAPGPTVPYNRSGAYVPVPDTSRSNPPDYRPDQQAPQDSTEEYSDSEESVPAQQSPTMTPDEED